MPLCASRPRHGRHPPPPRGVPVGVPAAGPARTDSHGRGVLIAELVGLLGAKPLEAAGVLRQLEALLDDPTDGPDNQLKLAHLGGVAALGGVLAKAMADRKCTGEQGRLLLRSATLLLATLAATPELHGQFVAAADSHDVVATVVGLLRNCAQARSAAEVPLRQRLAALLREAAAMTAAPKLEPAAVSLPEAVRLLREHADDAEHRGEADAARALRAQLDEFATELGQLAETETDGVEPIGMSLLANLSFPPPADPQGKAGSTAVARQVLSSGGVEVLLSALVFAPTSRTGQWAAAALCVRLLYFFFRFVTKFTCGARH